MFAHTSNCEHQEISLVLFFSLVNLGEAAVSIDEYFQGRGDIRAGCFRWREMEYKQQKLKIKGSFFTYNLVLLILLFKLYLCLFCRCLLQGLQYIYLTYYSLPLGFTYTFFSYHSLVSNNYTPSYILTSVNFYLLPPVCSHFMHFTSKYAKAP